MDSHTQVLNRILIRRKTTIMGKTLSAIVALGLWATASIAAPTLSGSHGPFSYDGGFVPDRKEMIGALYHLNGRFEAAFGDAITIKHHFTGRLGKQNRTFQGEWNYTQSVSFDLVLTDGILKDPNYHVAVIARGNIYPSSLQAHWYSAGRGIAIGNTTGCSQGVSFENFTLAADGVSPYVLGCTPAPLQAGRPYRFIVQVSKTNIYWELYRSQATDSWKKITSGDCRKQLSGNAAKICGSYGSESKDGTDDISIGSISMSKAKWMIRNLYVWEQKIYQKK